MKPLSEYIKENFINEVRKTSIVHARELDNKPCMYINKTRRWRGNMLAKQTLTSAKFTNDMRSIEPGNYCSYSMFAEDLLDLMEEIEQMEKDNNGLFQKLFGKWIEYDSEHRPGFKSCYVYPIKDGVTHPTSFRDVKGELILLYCDGQWMTVEDIHDYIRKNS